MWALDDGSLAYVHIPKNAGTSITEQLNLHPSTMNKNVMADLSENFSKHASAASIRKMLSKLHPSPVLFAVVRDPYARAHSMWRQFVTSIKVAYESGQSIYIEYDRHVTLTYGDEEFGFKRFLIDKPDWHWHPKYGGAKHIMNWHGWWPQWTWISDEKGEESIVDHVFDSRFLGPLRVMLSIRSIPIDLSTRLNVKTTGDWREKYDQESIKLVKKAFAIDFEKFGFSMDLTK